MALQLLPELLEATAAIDTGEVVGKDKKGEVMQIQYLHMKLQ